MQIQSQKNGNFCQPHKIDLKEIVFLVITPMSLLPIENHDHTISNHPNKQTKKDLILAIKVIYQL